MSTVFSPDAIADAARVIGLDGDSIQRLLDALSPAYDTAKFVLGPLCKNGHMWRETNQSLRYRSTRQCKECHVAWSSVYRKKYYEEHTDELRARARNYYYQNRDRELKRSQVYHKTDNYRRSAKKYREVNAEKLHQQSKVWKSQNKAYISNYNRFYYDRDPEYQIERRKRYNSTSRGKMVTQFNAAKRRAQKRIASGSAFSLSEWLIRISDFDHHCAYCGQFEKLTFDHVVPISRNGRHSLNNLIPACRSCNESKHNKDMETWYRSQWFFSEDRLIKIREIIDG